MNHLILTVQEGLNLYCTGGSGLGQMSYSPETTAINLGFNIQEHTRRKSDWGRTRGQICRSLSIGRAVSPSHSSPQQWMPRTSRAIWASHTSRCRWRPLPFIGFGLLANSLVLRNKADKKEIGWRRTSTRNVNRLLLLAALAEHKRECASHQNQRGRFRRANQFVSDIGYAILRGRANRARRELIRPDSVIVTSV